MLVDSFGRSITYLRISLTDRCNLRCLYCMPPQGIIWKPPEEILSYSEITKIVAASAQLGIHRVRLTGGEPLVRRDLPELVHSLASIPGIEEVSLTTNGVLLERLAKPLAEAGLKRVNISLDTLDANKFKQITRGGDIECVWRGIAAAEEANLFPIKINTVVVRGLNSDELLTLASLTLDHPWHIRFIELMPIGEQQDWGPGFPLPSQRYYSVKEIHQALASLVLKSTESPEGNGPSRTYQIPGARGTVGFISPLGEHFCASCNRLRLTADGKLRSCLFSEAEVDVKASIRRGESVKGQLLKALATKPEGHGIISPADNLIYPADPTLARSMSQIGG